MAGSRGVMPELPAFFPLFPARAAGQPGDSSASVGTPETRRLLQSCDFGDQADMAILPDLAFLPVSGINQRHQ